MKKIVTESGVFFTEKLTRKYENRKPWAPENPKELKAFIPGNIVEVFVKEGDKVAAGTPLLSFRAMKMVNCVEADAPGVIKSVRVVAEQAVAKGDIMIELA